MVTTLGLKLNRLSARFELKDENFQTKLPQDLHHSPSLAAVFLSNGGYLPNPMDSFLKLDYTQYNRM